MSLGDIIRNYRIQHDLTMQQFSDLSSLSKGYISMLESGRNPQNNRPIVPSIETIQKISTAMKMSIEQLLLAMGSEQLIDISHSSMQDVPGIVGSSHNLSDSEIELLQLFRACSREAQDHSLNYLRFLCVAEEVQVYGNGSED